MKKGEMVSFRRKFQDSSPRMGKILMLGFRSVLVETAEGIRTFVPMERMWRR